jgi:hypothetical protein
MPTISGTVYDNTAAPAVGRTVRAYRRDTGALLGQTTTVPDVAGDPLFNNVVVLHRFNVPEGTLSGAAIVDEGSISRINYSQLVGDSEPVVSQTDGPFPGTGCLIPNRTAISLTYDFGALNVGEQVGFILEFYVKLIEMPTEANSVVFQTLNSNITVDVDGTVRYQNNAVSGIKLSTTQWVHIAIVRRNWPNAGQVRVYLNGVEGYSTTNPWAIATQHISICSDGGNPPIGRRTRFKFAQFRYTRGADRYTANFTPPTVPFNNTTVSTFAGDYSFTTPTTEANFNDTSLLLHFDGANNSTVFTDSSNNKLTPSAIGGAVISTAQSRFGGSSALFNGISSYIVVPADKFNFLGNNFTIEFFVRRASGGTTERPLLTIQSSTGASLSSVHIRVDSFDRFVTQIEPGAGFWATSPVGSVTLDTWFHFAMVRNGGTMIAYLNGTEYSRSSTFTSAYVSNPASGSVFIGGLPSVGVSTPGYFSGYIDELRISNIARYTEDFTAPTAPFADGSDSEYNVVCLDDPAGTVYNDLILRTTPI